MLSGDKHVRNEEKKHPTKTEGAAPQASVNAPGPAASDGEGAGASAKDPCSVSAEEKKEGDEKSTADKLTALETENADLKDKYLRKYADLENFKKRIAREREESSKYSNAMLLLDIVNIIDDFERAIKSAQDGKDFKNFHAGISLIEKQLVAILEKKWGLERFSAKGAVFDPERHEAIMAEERADAQAATVVEDFQSGYLLHGRVLRPAKVKVVQPLSGGKSVPPQGELNKQGN